jgi:nitroreductase/NAD-dependent dihydropyrimidine dehydrogenase PreA subunit
MGLLTVDQEKCKHDGICIAVCPMGIIEFGEDGAYPTMTDGGDELCISCGHCVAVCPQAAMAHNDMQPDDCPPLRKEWMLAADQVEHFMRVRRSIRQYKKKAVDRKLLDRLIHVARFAPSGHNAQPVHWLVIHDSDEVYRLAGTVIDWMRSLISENSPLAATLHMDRVVSAWEAGADRVCRGAPHVILAHGHQESRTAPMGCTIALAHLELAAPAFGLGACWGGYFNTAANSWPPMVEALKLPEGHVCFGAMMVGFPKYDFHRFPLRNKANIIWR